MCVICVSASERPTPEMVAKMFADNPHGAGIAWRSEEPGKKGTPAIPVVAWKKGLDEEEIQELVAKLPLPFVAHFRIPSCGGPSSLLTHPFPIQIDVPLEFEGTTKGSVLFHNGHWHKYADVVLEASVRGNWKIPSGRWSDSRAMALIAAHQGIGVLEFIREKVVVFGPGPADIELFGDNGWAKIGTGIWVSNRGWEHKQVKGFPRAIPSADKKDEVVAESDKEEPPARGGTETRLASGSGDKSEKSAEVVKGPLGIVNGGALLKGRPFETYMSAVRLWKAQTISNNAFRKARRKYEEHCRKQKCQPLPRPKRWEQGISIH